MSSKFYQTCIFDHEIHEIVSETNDMYQLRTITVFPREYFVPKDQVEFKEPDVNLGLNKREWNLIISCINLMLNNLYSDQIQTEESLDKIRTKIETRLANEQN